MKGTFHVKNKTHIVLLALFLLGLVCVTVSAKVDSPDFRPGYYVARGSGYIYPMIYIGNRYDDDTVPVSFHDGKGRAIVEVTGKYTSYGKITLPRRIDGDNVVNMYSGRIFHFAGRQYEIMD
jgi:hypothetical protein